MTRTGFLWIHIISSLIVIAGAIYLCCLFASISTGAIIFTAIFFAVLLAANVINYLENRDMY